MKKILLLAIISTLLISCQQGLIYTHFEHIDPQGWHADSVLSFHPEIEDSVGEYQVQILIRHTDRYAYQNLWLFVDIMSDSLQLRRDTIEAELADPRGRWYGGGTSTISLPLLYIEQISLEKGAYTIHVQQGMREEHLRAITEVGVKVARK